MTNINYRNTEKNNHATALRIVRAARALAVASWIGAVACVLVTALGIGSEGSARSATVAATLSTDGLPRVWAASIAGILALVTGGALVELARMLGRVTPDALFSSAVTKHFRRFACLLMVAAVLRVLLPAAASVWLASHSGVDAVRLEFSGDDLLSLLPVAVFFFVARLFDEAARLEDDQRSIV
jgi:hypothetical protein